MLWSQQAVATLLGEGWVSKKHQDCCRKIEKRHLEVVGVGIRIDVLAPDAAARALQAESDNCLVYVTYKHAYSAL